jgi:ABC-type uncharacterized transport system substrate-binding protein
MFAFWSKPDIFDRAMSASPLADMSCRNVLPFQPARLTQYDALSRASGAAMRRREFVSLLSSAAVTWPVVGHAQQRVMPVVGVLCAGTAEALERYLASFREGMRQLGYVEGSNVRFEFRFADGYLDRLPDLANELVRLNPSVIVSTPLPAHLAARKATSAIPIVMATATGADPVGFGLVASLSHPGGNVTGLANFAEMLASKQIDLLREMLPRLARFGLLVNVTNQLHVPQLRETKIAAEAAGIQLVPVEVSSPDKLDSAFATLGTERVEALLVPPDTTFYSRRRQIADLAARTRLPTIYGYREHVEDGGLMSYGPDIPDQYRRAANYLDKILKGAQPADLPVEQPTKIELVINLKTARALGLEIPPTLLARADEVIE